MKASDDQTALEKSKEKKTLENFRLVSFAAKTSKVMELRADLGDT